MLLLTWSALIFIMRRLCLIGLLKERTDLISVWLRNRSFFVGIDGQSSIFYDFLLGTVQGSMLGPIKYAIDVRPLFEICGCLLLTIPIFLNGIPIWQAV
jgi:hypothetical protein